MLQPFTITGGARVGWTNATWPLATLSSGPDKLTLSVKILGTYDFAPDEVSAVEKLVWFPVLASGIQIYHCKADCPQRIIFWCLGSPESVLRGIRDSGFIPAATASARPQRRGIPIRWSAIIIAIVVWNALAILLASHHADSRPQLSPLTFTPLALVFLICIGIEKSALLQRLILKPGRDVGEIRPFLRLLIFISGLLLVIFTILFASGAFNTVSRTR
jgi:hypothetical protein